MAEQDVLNNQKTVLDNQKTIIENQNTIIGNQHLLEEIVKNQQTILSLLKK